MTSSSFGNGSFTFTWTIENFSFCLEQKGCCLHSPKFPIDMGDKTEWTLHLYPRGHSEDGYISCDLHLNSHDAKKAEKITVSNTISIDCADGFSHFSVERINQQFPNACFCGIQKFVKRDEIFTNKGFYLPKDSLTIRCELRRRASEKPVTKVCGVRSQVGVKRISVPWDIKNFSAFQLNRHLTFPMTLNLERVPHFEISFYLEGETLDSSHVQIDIKKISRIKSTTSSEFPFSVTPAIYELSILVSTEIFVLDLKGIPLLAAEGQYYFPSSESYEVWKLPELIKRSDLCSKKNLYLSEDVLFLHFEFAVSVGQVASLPVEFHTAYPERRSIKPSSTLKDDFHLLLQEQVFSDVTLKTEDKVFRAHKAVVAFRSPVFRAMFESGMAESNTGVVNISDVDSETLGYLLTFMYADKVEDDVDFKSAVKLYRAADKYQIFTLKERCCAILKPLVSTENVCEVLSIAFKYSDDTLKTMAKAFICKHPSETLESSVWERLMEKRWREEVTSSKLIASKPTFTAPAP